MNEQNYITMNYISLKQLVDILLYNKLLIILVTSLFSFLSISYALLQEDIYKSNTLVAVQDSESSGLSPAISQYSGLASIAGISLPSGGSQFRSSTIIETIQSRIFFKNLITKYEVLPQIMAFDSYNKNSKEIKFNEDIYNSAKKSWVSSKPSFVKSYLRYISMLGIKQDPRTKFITIDIQHQSPIFSHYLLEVILIEINSVLRQQDLAESQRAIDYLKLKITETQLQEVRDSFSRLITSQQEKEMMADIKKDYALKIIDPPIVPEFKFKPQRSVIVIYITMLGFFLSIFFILFRHFISIISKD